MMPMETHAAGGVFRVVSSGAGAAPSQMCGNYYENGTVNGKPCYEGPNGYWISYGEWLASGVIRGDFYWFISNTKGGMDINRPYPLYYLENSGVTPPTGIDFYPNNQVDSSSKVRLEIPSLPEINVQGNAISIADGDTTPVLADNTDFGNVNVDSGTVSKTFTFQNTGTDTLTLTGTPRVAVTGTSAADFTVTSAPAGTVAPGNSTTFSVAFNPNGTGLRSAEISILNSDWDESPYNFAIQGVGTTIVSSVSVPASATYAAGQNLDFTVNFSGAVIVNTGAGTPWMDITVGSQHVRAYYVSGNGTAALTFRYTAQSGDFDADGISVGSISLNLGTIRDIMGYDADPSLNNIGNTTEVKIDAVAPGIPSIPDMLAAFDTGISDDDNITNNLTPILTGTAEPYSMMKLYAIPWGVVGSGQADLNGIWNIPIVTFPGIEFVQYTATATDTVGNESAQSPGISIRVNVQLPNITSVGVSDTEATSEDVTVTVTAMDETAGNLYYSFDGGVTWQMSNSRIYASNTTIAPGTIRVKDVAGNIRPYDTEVAIDNIDKTAPGIPSLKLNDAAPKGSTEWYAGAPVVTITPPAYTAGTAAETTYYKLWKIENPEPLEGTAFTGTQPVISSDGTWQLSAWTQDAVGNRSTDTVTVIKVDSVPAAVTDITYEIINAGAFSRVLNLITFGQFFREGFLVTITAEDSLSGVSTIQYAEFDSAAQLTAGGVSGSATVNADGQIQFIVSSDFKGIIKAKAADCAGGTSAWTGSAAVINESASPVISAADTDASGYYQSGSWQKNAVELSVGVAEPGASFSGINNIRYAVNPAVPDDQIVWTEAASLFQAEVNTAVTQSLSDLSVMLAPGSNGAVNGENKVVVRAEDNSGNVAVRTFHVWIDNSAPTGSVTIKENEFTSFLNTITFGLCFRQQVDVSMTGADAVSGVQSVAYQKVAAESDYNEAGTWTSYTDQFQVPANEKFILYTKITDQAGNVTIVNSNGIVVYTDSALVTAVKYFDKDTTKEGYQDIPVEMTLNGNTLRDIRNGAATLVKDTDYTVSGSTVTLKKEYLQGALTDTMTLTFRFNPQGEVYGTGEEPAEAALTIHSLIHAAVPGFTTNITSDPAVYEKGSTAAELTVAASAADSGTLTYQWYKSSENAATGTAIVGADEATYTPSTVVTGVSYYYAVATNTNNAVNGNKTASAASTICKITVNNLEASTSTPKVTLGDVLSDIRDAALSGEDIEKLANGSDISIRLYVEETAAPGTDGQLVQASLDGMTVGQYYDLTLIKDIDGTEYTVTALDDSITITFTIPQALRQSGRIFEIARVHNGVVTFLTDLDQNPDTITIRTDRFSTYALVYENPKTTSSSGSSASSASATAAVTAGSVDTGDYAPITGLFLLLAVSGAGIIAGVGMLRKKKNY